jgi:hypothetical protein
MHWYRLRIKWGYKKNPIDVQDSYCGLVVTVPGYTTEMYCASCEVRTEFIYVMKKKVDRLCDLVFRVPVYRSRGSGSIPGSTRFSK